MTTLCICCFAYSTGMTVRVQFVLTLKVSFPQKRATSEKHSTILIPSRVKVVSLLFANVRQATVWMRSGLIFLHACVKRDTSRCPSPHSHTHTHIHTHSLSLSLWNSCQQSSQKPSASETDFNRTKHPVQRNGKCRQLNSRLLSFQVRKFWDIYKQF